MTNLVANRADCSAGTRSGKRRFHEADFKPRKIAHSGRFVFSEAASDGDEHRHSLAADSASV